MNPAPYVAGGALSGFMLYRKFFTGIDKHPNVAGQYLKLNVAAIARHEWSAPPRCGAPRYSPVTPDQASRHLLRRSALCQRVAHHLHNLRAARHGWHWTRG